MPDVSTSDAIRSFGNTRMIAPPSHGRAGQSYFPDLEERIKAEKRAVTESNAALLHGDWGNQSPTDVHAGVGVQTPLAAHQLGMASLSAQIATTFGTAFGATSGTTAAWLSGLPSGITTTASPIGQMTNGDNLTAFAEAISNLHASFEFRDKNTVISFLYSNPSLIPVLQDAPNNISEYFEDVSSLVLEVVSDPEGPDADRLFLFVQTQLPAELAIERLHQLDDEWWLDAMSDDDKMTIDIERL